MSERCMHLDICKGDVGRYVILPGDPKRVPVIASLLDNAVPIADKREFVTYTGYLDGVKVSVTSTGIGGPSASIAAEELHQSGADTFIRVGTCGGIDLDVKAGDVVIATGAVRNEGTSREYAPIEFPAVPDFLLASCLKEAAEDMHLRYHMGIVHCKDSFYGQISSSDKPTSYELAAKWEAWKRLGVLASEMESAAIFTVSSYLRTRAASILHVVHNQERASASLDDNEDGNVMNAVKTAVAAIRKIIRIDSVL